jgi:hypothetical protein
MIDIIGGIVMSALHLGAQLLVECVAGGLGEGDSDSAQAAVAQEAPQVPSTESQDKSIGQSA